MGACGSVGVPHDHHSWVQSAKDKRYENENEENRQYLERLFAGTKPLCDFSENLLDELYYKSKERKFTPGECVYSKGQVAHAFYIVMTGNVITDDSNGTIVSAGEMFGQMEIIENFKCLRTMRAGKKGCTLRQIRRVDFDAALEKKNSVLQTNVFKVLMETPVFSGLSERELMALKDQLHLKTFAPGEVIIKKGDTRVDEMYIIEDGAVIVTDFAGTIQSALDMSIFGLMNHGLGPKKTATLEKRGYFGEGFCLQDHCILFHSSLPRNLTPPPPPPPRNPPISHRRGGTVGRGHRCLGRGRQVAPTRSQCDGRTGWLLLPHSL